MESGTSANHMDMESATYKNQTLKIRTAHLTNCCTEFTLYKVYMFFPTRQVRVVRFYVSCLLPSFLPSFLPRRRAVGPQPRAAMSSVPCRTCTAKTATIWAQCSLPDQLRPAVPSVPCRTSTATICAQCSLPDLNREIECQKICQKECQRERPKECQKKCQKDCHKIICQKEYQTKC